jgi:oligopeptide transport system permease protein
MLDSNGDLVPNFLRFTQADLDVSTDEGIKRATIHARLMGASGTAPVVDGVMFYIISQGDINTINTVQVRLLQYNYFIYRRGVAPAFWFGTTSDGRDIFSGVMYGLRLSLGLAVLVSLISIILGMIIGALCGYYGGKVDLLVSRIKDIISGLPFIVVMSLFYLHLVLPGRVPIFAALLIGFVFISWVGYARLVRTQFFRFKNQEYVLASRTLGAKDARLMIKHIFPNSLGTLITSFALAIPFIILTEVVLFFLGVLQLEAGGTTLGITIQEGAASVYSHPHVVFFPVLVFSLIMLSFNMVGNSLRDSFDPLQRGK